MDSGQYAELLGDAMQWGVSLDRYLQLSPAAAQCLAECECNTVNRVAMWCAQTGHESCGLLYMEEIADGSAYEGREDLGNTEPGDGCRFKGRGPIMVTGRSNYTECSSWAYDQGLVPSPTFFVDCPEEMAGDVYGFMGVTWYWTTQRPMNDAADAGDIELATYYVNGGYNGLDDRTQRWNHCLSIGDPIMGLTEAQPAGAAPQLVGERVLSYDSSIVPQETGYWCGPASTQVTLNAQGVSVSEQQLANEMGTDMDGTDDISLIADVLRSYVPAADYRDLHINNDPPTAAEKDALWAHLVNSINSGHGMVMNWVAPPGNYPVGIKGSPSPSYGGGTVFHYVAAMGYDDNPSQRAVWMADSGFNPFEYWISFDQCATLIPPKGYAYAAVEPPAGPTGEDEMAGLTVEEHDWLAQLWGAFFNPVAGASEYTPPEEGEIHATKDMLRYTDGNIYSILTEHRAMLGDPHYIGVVKAAADRGNAWAAHVYDLVPDQYK